jgi:hypothetical protein
MKGTGLAMLQDRKNQGLDLAVHSPVEPANALSRTMR